MSARKPWQQILGILGNIFEFDGGDGPKIKNTSGVIEMRNAADAAYVITRGLDPVGANDYVTKSYHDSTPPAGSVQCIEVPFDFNDAGTAVDSTQVAAAGGRLVDVKVEITTAFDANMDIEAGDTGDPDRFVLATEVKEEKLGLSEFPQYTDTIASVFRLTLGASSATAGVGRALFFYTVPVA